MDYVITPVVPLSPIQYLHQIHSGANQKDDTLLFSVLRVCVGRHTPLRHWSRPCYRFLFILSYNTIAF